MAIFRRLYLCFVLVVLRWSSSSSVVEVMEDILGLLGGGGLGEGGDSMASD